VFPNPQNPFSAPFPETYSINNLAGNMSGVNFVAVKVGDVNGSAAPNDFDAPTEDRSGETLQLSVQEAAMQPGEEQRFDFKVKNFRDIIGYQFTLDFDAQVLDFERVEMGALATLSESNFGFRLLDEGVLTTSWNDASPVSIADDAVLFSVVFKAKEPAKRSAVLRIGSDFTKAEAYFENGEMLDLALNFETTTLPEKSGQAIPYSSSLKISPNPFSDFTALNFTLEEAQSVGLAVFDAAGRVVLHREAIFQKGYNALKINRLELPSAGTYFFRLQTKDEVSTGKLVLID
jgi:hypothetical protein